MNQDCLALQSEEIEALKAIYGDEWRTDDSALHSHSICLPFGDSFSLTLHVHLPSDYPKAAPPTFELEALDLPACERHQLVLNLQSVYLDHVGESVLYQWVEAVKEFLTNRSTSSGVDAQSTFDESDDAIEENAGYSGKTDFGRPAVVVNSVAGTAVPEINSGDTITDRKSIFQAHLAVVSSKSEVGVVLERLMENRKVASATHNIYAYRIKQENAVISDCADDGEHNAGSRLLHLLNTIEAHNVLVVVSRWYGGIHLGPDRFKHINNAARDILQKHGYIKPKNMTEPTTISRSDKFSRK